MSARLAVRVRPGARRAEIKGWLADRTLQLAVVAPPEGGRANEAVAELLAEALGLKVRDIEVVRGQRSRAKLIEVRGLEESEIRRRLERAQEEAR